jgi:hypothetical protein
MLAMVMTVYDGILSMIFQPIMGAVFAGVAVALCFVLGLPVRFIRPVHEFWRRAWWLPFFLGSLGFVLMVMSWVLRQTVHDPATQLDVETFQPALAISGYLLSVFAALHFWFPLLRFLRRASSDVHAKT